MTPPIMLNSVVFLLNFIAPPALTSTNGAPSAPSPPPPIKHLKARNTPSPRPPQAQTHPKHPLPPNRHVCSSSSHALRSSSSSHPSPSSHPLLQSKASDLRRANMDQNATKQQSTGRQTNYQTKQQRLDKHPLSKAPTIQSYFNIILTCLDSHIIQ